MRAIFGLGAPAIAALLLAGALGALFAPMPSTDLVSTSADGGARAGASSNVVVHAPGALVLDASAYPGALPSFEERYVGTTEGDEPTLGIDSTGAAYYLSVSRYVYTNTSVTDVDAAGGLHPMVMKSVDDGRTWADVSPTLAPARTGVAPLDEIAETPTITGDPYLYVDAASGRVFSYQQQSYLLCDDWAVSATGGASWDHSTTCPAFVVDGDSYGDHPTITSGAPRAHATSGIGNVVYFCSDSGCRASFDGGASWGAWSDPWPSCPNAVEDEQLGHVKTAPDGTLLVPRKACGGAMLSISQDDGATFHDLFVDKSVWTKGAAPDDDTSDHDAAVAADASGNLYYLWTGEDRLPYLAVSRDMGASWSAPMMVAAPGVTYALFPEIVAGADGHIAIMYMGTTSACKCREDDNATWSDYVGFSLDAHDARPVFATTTAHDPQDPVRRGACYNFRCYIAPGAEGNGVPNQGVYDFMDLKIDPVTHAVWVAMVDLCNGHCATREGSSSDVADSRAAVGIQVGGTTL